MEFYKLALLIEELEKISSRKELAEKVMSFLKAMPEENIPRAIRFLLGKSLPDKELGVSGGIISEVMEEIFSSEILAHLPWTGDFGDTVKYLWENYHPLPPSRLSLKEVEEYLLKIAEKEGEGAREGKKRLLKEILLKLSPSEARLLVKIILGEMRHGVKEGLLLWGLSEETGIEEKKLEELLLKGKNFEELVIEALKGEIKEEITPLFKPFPPMLAETAPSVKDAFDYERGETAVEYKLDGVRIQVHKAEDILKIFSRRGSEITQNFPEIGEVLKDIKGKFILDGEVIAISFDGKPLPFQELMKRFRRKKILRGRMEIPVRFFFFDILLKGEKLLFSLPYEQRRKILQETLPSHLLVPSKVISNPEEGERFLEKAIREGHEGIMVKYLGSSYLPGKRVGGWYKIKKVISLDLVILGAEWGHGRRKNWLSDYYLGIKMGKEFLCVGKTFKGLSDRELEEITGKLLNIKIKEEGNVIWVNPEIVVEVTFNEIQKSPHYPSGFALRFARIERIREDKSPEEIDSLETLKQLYHQQFRYKGKKTSSVQLELFPQEE